MAVASGGSRGGCHNIGGRMLGIRVDDGSVSIYPVFGKIRFECNEFGVRTLRMGKRTFRTDSVELVDWEECVKEEVNTG